MADFTISARIIMEATEAIKTTEQIKSDMADISSETSLTSRKTEIDVKKMTASFALLGATAGGALAAIISASPSMTVAMMEMQFALQQVALAIGEDLAPIIQDTLVPVIEAFRDFVLSLNPEIRKWIGITILLTAAISALALAVIALNTVSLPLIALVVGIAAAIAAIIIIWQNWHKIVNTAINLFNKYRDVIEIVLMAIGPIGWAILGIIYIMENWNTIIATLQEAWITFSDVITDVWDTIVEAVEDGWNFILGLWESATTIFGQIVDAIMAPFKAAWNAIVDFINSTVISFVNNSLIPAVNTILPAKWELGPIGELPSLAVGLSYVPRNMAANLHEGERVLTAEENKAYSKNMRGGGDTYQFNNTFEIGAVTDRRFIRMLVDEVETVQARQARRRGNR